MNKMQEICCVVVVMILSGMPLMGQTTEGEIASMKAGTIHQKFEFMKDQSGNYLDNKVVKISMLNALEAMISDTIQELSHSLQEVRLKHQKSKEALDEYREKVGILQDSLSVMESNQSNMSFLGASMSKGTFTALMWLIIGILLLIIAYLIYEGKDNRVLVEEGNEMKKRLQEEYDGFRKRALEREQKLKRELMDERNKN